MKTMHWVSVVILSMAFLFSLGITGCTREAPLSETPPAVTESPGEGLGSLSFEALLEEGRARLEAEDRAGASEVLRALEARPLAERPPEQRESFSSLAGDVYFEAGIQAWREGDYEKAFADFDQTVVYFDGDDADRLATLNELKAMMAHERGELDLALSQYQMLLTAYGELDDELGLARSELKIATVQSEQGALESAQQLTTQALGRFEALDFSEGVAAARLQLGMVQHLEGALEAAGENYDRARRLLTDLDSGAPLADVWANRGEVDLEQGQPLAAIERFRNALVIHREAEDATWIAYGTVRLAQALTWAGSAEEASLELAKLELEEILDPSTVAEGMLVSAWVELAAGRLDVAAARARSAVEALEGSERRDDLLRMRLFEGEIALLRGQAERARTLAEASAEAISATESRTVRWRARGLAAQLRSLDSAEIEDTLVELEGVARDAAAAGHVALAAELALDRVEVAWRAGEGQRAQELLASLLAEHEGSEIVDHLRRWGAMLERELDGSRDG